MQHVTGNAQICVLLQTSEGQSGRSGGNAIQEFSGIGCCLLVTNIRPNSIVEADFLSSVSYTPSSEKQHCHFQASWAGPIVVCCHREQWYQPKTRRKKHSLARWTLGNLLYFGIPAVLVFIMCATMIPLWVWYVRTHQSIRTQDILVVATCGFGFLFVAVMLAVIFHEKILFQNWVDSFLNEGKPQRFWKRIMPY